MKPRRTAIAAMIVAIALVLSACGGAGSGEDAASAFSTCPLDNGVADATAKPIGKHHVYIGAFAAWDESVASAYLMKNILENNGYDAEVKTLDIDAAFSATAFGQLDALTDVWLPSTHRTYIDEYRSQLDALGCWYDGAKVTITVNNSSPAQSIADLRTMGDAYQNTLVGVEPGAGETALVNNRVIPEYGLHNLTFRSVSTADMLASLRQAQTNHTNVAVTLWRPHWAYSEFALRDLRDPKRAMGGTNGIWTFANKGFAARSPKAAQMFTNLVFTDPQLSQLEDLMTEKDQGDDPDDAVIEWLNAHPDFAGRLVRGSLG